MNTQYGVIADWSGFIIYLHPLSLQVASQVAVIISSRGSCVCYEEVLSYQLMLENLDREMWSQITVS